VLAIDDALTKLEALSPRQARIVELRCLVGMSVVEVADALDVSERTVHSEWRLARAWLTRELAPSE
jgi:RNA polymerase sigma factor (sigma-70 family)